MRFQDLKDDSSQALAKQVERLRLEVSLAERGYLLQAEGEDAEPILPADGAVSPALVAGFQSAQDFTVREQTLNYTTGDSYTGETLGSLRHGRGTHTCANGDVYSGQWRYDKREGTGKMTFARGLEYEGHWKEDKAHGEGAAKYENGGLYIGSFADDLRSGWGLHRFPNGDAYEGEWKADMMTGKGQYTYADGSHFEGEFLEGRRVKGKLVSADSSFEYSGGWKDTLRHGYGVCFQRGLYKHMGEWRDDLQHGQGKCIYADGSQYDGEWKEGKRHGAGKFSAGPLRYEGEWRDDRQHGMGSFITAAGDKYVGEFADGKRHGKGRCLYADGAKYEGEWQGDMRHGKGTCLFASGDKYQGEWQRDKRHGQGVCKFADGRKFKGEWEDDGWVQSAADPARCRVAGPGVTRAVAGQKAELVIEARDETGSKRLSGGDDFQASLWPASTAAGGGSGSGDGSASGQPIDPVTAEVKDNGDGTYAVAYTARVAGVYELHITVDNEEHVADSPYPLRVLPARPCAKRSQVSGAGRSAALAGAPAQFAVAARDEFGNRWSGDPAQLRQLLPLEAKLTGGCGTAELAVQAEATREGTFLCSYTVPSPGFWRLHVEIGGQALPGAPFSVHAADPSAAPAIQAAAAGAGAQAEGDAADSAGSQSGEAGAGSADSEPAASGPDGAASALAAVPAPPAPPPVPAIRDEMRVWEQIAAAAFAEPDGSMAGWDSDEERRKKAETKEDSYIKAHPNVPVVENLEDLWKVTRLQNQRKSKEEAAQAEKLKGMRAQLERTFGPAQPPSQAEVMAAVQEILQEDAVQRHPTLGAQAGAKAAPATPALPGSAGESVPTDSSSSSSEAAAAPSAGAAGPASMAARAPRLAGGRAGLKAAASALAELD